MTIRLQKLLSQAGIASRRAAEKLIVEGRVAVNGETVRELGTKADPSDEIRVDGRRIRAAQRRRYILLNKPSGYVTTRSDPERRRTVLDLLDGVREYVYPVGRLDYDTEGLLLLTNDGDLAAQLTHPRHGVERTYEARVAGVPDDAALERLRRGIPLDGHRTRPATVELVSRRGPAKAGPNVHDAAPAKAGPSVHDGAAVTGGPYRRRETGRKARSVVRLTIREGRNRQVRRMLEAVGHPVEALTRTRIGPLTDRHLKPGEWRELTGQELDTLTKWASERSGKVEK